MLIVMNLAVLTPSTHGTLLVSAMVAFYAVLPFTMDLADRVFTANYDWNDDWDDDWGMI